MFGTLADIVLLPATITTAVVKGTAEAIDEALDLDD